MEQALGMSGVERMTSMQRFLQVASMIWFLLVAGDTYLIHISILDPHVQNEADMLGRADSV